MNALAPGQALCVHRWLILRLTIAQGTEYRFDLCCDVCVFLALEVFDFNTSYLKTCWVSLGTQACWNRCSREFGVSLMWFILTVIVFLRKAWISNWARMKRMIKISLQAWLTDNRKKVFIPQPKTARYIEQLFNSTLPIINKKVQTAVHVHSATTNPTAPLQRLSPNNSSLRTATLSRDQINSSI